MYRQISSPGTYSKEERPALLFAFTSTPVRYMDVDDPKRAEEVDRILERLKGKSAPAGEPA